MPDAQPCPKSELYSIQEQLRTLQTFNTHHSTTINKLVNLVADLIAETPTTHQSKTQTARPPESAPRRKPPPENHSVTPDDEPRRPQFIGKYDALREAAAAILKPDVDPYPDDFDPESFI